MTDQTPRDIIADALWRLDGIHVTPDGPDDYHRTNADALIGKLTAAGFTVEAADPTATWRPAQPGDTPGQVEPDDATPPPLDLIAAAEAEIAAMGPADDEAQHWQRTAAVWERLARAQAAEVERRGRSRRGHADRGRSTGRQRHAPGRTSPHRGHAHTRTPHSPTRRNGEPSMIEVNAVDRETGERMTATLKPGQYVLICAEPAYLAREDYHHSGRTVLTLVNVSPEPGEITEHPPEPRTWGLPAEPGPEVTAVRDSGDGTLWKRFDTAAPDGHVSEHWWYPEGGDPQEDGTDWDELVAGAWPGKLTDATAEEAPNG